MKKRLCLVLSVLLFLFCGCDYIPSSEPAIHKVPSPLAYPDYSVSENPTTEELRQTAVRAMRDLLSIQWTPAYGISYYNTAGRDKQFDYVPGTPYGGLLYTGAGSGLFQFLEYYDPETGLLTYPGSGDELRKAIGSSCADSLLWSWGTVANSFSCGYYPSVMVQQNGFLPVGNYTYDENLKSFYLQPTHDIIEANGADVMLDAYAKLQPADALISSSVDHAMMAIEKPVVVYDVDGTINAKKSYITIQDQRGGKNATAFYEVMDGETTIYFNSQTAMRMDFKTLLEKNYIPVTLAEFTGEKAYEKAVVTTQGKECTDFKHLQNVMLESNYPIAFISAVLVDKNGNESELDKLLFHGANGDGPPKTYNLSQWETLHTLETKNYTSIKIEVVVSTGERFTPIDVPLN